MPQVRALTSFKGRLGNIRAGMQFHCDPSYIRELNKKIKQVEIVSAEDVTSGEPGPGSNKNVPRAPGPLTPAEKDKGKVPAGSTPPAQTGNDSADLQGAGTGLLSASSPPVPPSTVTTASVSGAGARAAARKKKSAIKQPAK